MGNLVSVLDSRSHNPSQPTSQSPSSSSTTTTTTTTSSGQVPPRSATSRTTAPPSYIPLPPPIFGSISLSPSPSHQLDDPFDLDPPSPCLFFTAPSSPLVDLEPPPRPVPVPVKTPDSPPAPALHISIPPPGPLPQSDPLHNESPLDDAYPTSEVAIDLALDDEGLSTLEKIYLFSRSKAAFHRVFITHALPSFLEQVTPLEAIEYVLPLLSGLAMDEDEAVKEALAAELVPIIWWFFTHCQIVPDDLRTDETVYPSALTSTTISVQAFTPILGTLLLSLNGMVGGTARYAVVDILSRMRKADEKESNDIGLEAKKTRHEPSSSKIGHFPHSDEEDDEELVIGLFGKEERAMFEQEILQQVVIGMGRLDVDVEEVEEQGCEEWDRPMDVDANVEASDVGVVGEVGHEGGEGVMARETEQRDNHGEKSKRKPQQSEGENINPYFPVLASSYSVPSPGSSASSTPSPASDTTSSSSSSPSPSFAVDSLSVNSVSPPGISTSNTSAVSSDDSTSTSPSSFPQPSAHSPVSPALRSAQSQAQYEALSATQFRPHSDYNLPDPDSIHAHLANSTNNFRSSPVFAAPFRPSNSHSPDRDSTPTLNSSQSRFAAEIGAHNEVSLELGDWMPPAPRPSHATLPPPRQSPPLEAAPHSPTLGASSAFSTGTREGGSEAGTRSGVGHGADQDIGGHDGLGIGVYGEIDGEGEQAAVGRLSSMSLMAAVTASGSLGEETKHAFVQEVERVGRDPVYWVRREASFAVGALAKVVPEEVVLCSLLPLFESLRRDSVWHVRHSAVFALPVILSRLSPKQRRSLALETILPLSTDDSPTVRSGVLEALGEVLYTFHQDRDGPPEELLRLFLGRREDRRVRDGQQRLDEQAAHVKTREDILNSIFGMSRPPSMATTEHPFSAKDHQSPLESFYNDPARPLICAFNYPAVAATLGRERWGELREVYLELVENRAVNVRRTLAASLGELAKIIGEENAKADLVDVWWDAVRCDEEEVRGKAVECIADFVEALGEDARVEIVQGLLTVWEEGGFIGWREREGVAKALVKFVKLIGQTNSALVRGLLRKALEDNVAAVREAAVAALPVIWMTFASRVDVLNDLRNDVESLAQSSTHRRRMTFVACQQTLITPRQDGQAVVADDQFWQTFTSLANDNIIGVRIGVARLVGYFYAQFIRNSHYPSSALLDLVRQLSQDASHEVRSYVPDPLRISEPHADISYQAPAASSLIRKHASNYSTFSRPPPPPAAGTSQFAGSGPEPHGMAVNAVRHFSGQRSNDNSEDIGAALLARLNQLGDEDAATKSFGPAGLKLHQDGNSSHSISSQSGGPSASEGGGHDVLHKGGEDDEVFTPDFGARADVNSEGISVPG